MYNTFSMHRGTCGATRAGCRLCLCFDIVSSPDPPKVSRNETMSPRFSSPRACLALPSSHPSLCIFRACYMFQGQNSNIIESKHSQTSAPYVQFYKIQYIIRTAQSFKGWKPILQGCLAMAHIATFFSAAQLGTHQVGALSPLEAAWSMYILVWDISKADCMSDLKRQKDGESM